MKSSLGKLGRKLSMTRSDVKDKKDLQMSPHLEELAQASKDMQDMRNCYDSLLSAAAATANSIFEFAESLNEMGMCLLDKTTVDPDDESGKVLSTLGNMQSELQKIADTYRSYVVVTVTNPTESLLSELRKVEEMKLQCDEKREAYEYMMAQHKDKGKSKSGKVESSVIQKLQEAQDEYNEVARLCAFRVKSLKEGQCRSLLAQAARHHAAQLNFFRKGVKVLEEVDPHVRTVAEKHRIDCQLSDVAAGEEGEGISNYESTDDGEQNFDYRQKKQGLTASSNPMELDRVDTTYPQVPNLADSEINASKYQAEQIAGRQRRVSSYSAPLYPEKTDPSGKQPKETQPAKKYYSYVLPPPVDTKTSISKPPTSTFQHPLPDEKHEKDSGVDNTSTSASALKPARSTETATSSSTQLPAPSTERFSFPQRHSTGQDGKSAAKRQAYSGPLTPSKSFSGKMMSSSGGPNVSSRSVSPPTLTSPKISELHELPRPPTGNPSLTFSKPSGLIGHTPPLFFKNQETSSQPPNKRPILVSTVASPLPIPPLVVSRSFSIPSTTQRAMSSLHVPDLKVSPHPGHAPSPPLTPVSLANVTTVSDVAAHMAHI